MRKKLLSVILAIAMLACMIPLGMVTASAETVEIESGEFEITESFDHNDFLDKIFAKGSEFKIAEYWNHGCTCYIDQDNLIANENFTLPNDFDLYYCYKAFSDVEEDHIRQASVHIFFLGLMSVPFSVDENVTMEFSDILVNKGVRYVLDKSKYFEYSDSLSNIPYDINNARFKPTAKSGYKIDSVTMDTTTLSPDKDGWYSMATYTGTQTITVKTVADVPPHTHTKGTEYMTDGRAHWIKCDDENCPLNKADDPVLAYEIAFSSYEGPELKEALDYSETCHTNGADTTSMLMGRQGKVDKSTGTVSNTDGRTIIGLTQDQLDKIGNKLVIVGSDDSDNNKQVSVDVDCAYTWFYDIADGKPAQIKAEDCDCAAFVIIDSSLAGTITGFGYYRVYNDTVSDSTLIGEALYKTPRTFKAVFDTTGGANTLNFYFDYNDHAGEGTLYNNLPTEANKASSWGYDGWRRNINHVNIDPTVIKYKGLKSTNNMFYGMENASSIKGAEYLDVSSVTDMHAMFYDFGRSDQSSINEVPAVERWNTSSVTNMTQIFYRYGENSQNLNFALDLSGWDVSHVSTVSQEFQSTALVSGKFSVTIPHYTKGLEGIKENSTGRWYTINTNKYFTPLSAGTAGKRFIVAQ